MAECTVQELALRVRDGRGDGERLPRFALFLGAGASIASGIPGTESMVRLFREKLEERRRAEGDRRGFNRWARERYNWDSKAGDYSNFFEAFEPTENGRARHIEELVSRGTPSFGYLCLAQLLSGGYLNTVVTTNFDDLAYEACALWTGVRPRVYAYGAVSEAIRQETGRPTILKLHDDFLYSRLKNTGTEVARVDPNMESEVRRILSGPERYELIVSGYGGEDGSIMELLKGVPDQRALYWCVYRDNPLSERVEELIKRSNVFLVKTEGFDRLMDELLNTVGFTLPDLEQSVREQREAIVEIIGRIWLAIRGQLCRSDRGSDDCRVGRFRSTRSPDRSSSRQPSSRSAQRPLKGRCGSGRFGSSPYGRTRPEQPHQPEQLRGPLERCRSDRRGSGSSTAVFEASAQQCSSSRQPWCCPSG